MTDCSHDTPLDEAAFKHQLLLLKSAHCGRHVLHKGLHQFINGLSLYQNGGSVAMTVWIAGKKDGVDSAEVQIPPSTEPLQRVVK